MHPQRVTRRRFLDTTGLTLAAPWVLPSNIWSAEVAPNDRITLGFIGMGKQNGGHLSDFLRRKETHVAAVCDVDTTRRERARKTANDFYARRDGQAGYDGCAATHDFQELLDRKDIDAVVIATPDHWHAPIAVAAAKARKDIYCEKPLCQSIHEARAMVDAVRKYKVIFQTGSQQRSSPEFRIACELARNGRIGQIQTVEVAVGGPPQWCDLPGEAAEPGLDWDRWLGPAPQRPYNSILSPRGVHDHFPAWRNYREYGGGGVTDWGAHHFDIAQWGLGMDENGPVEITPPDDPKAGHGVALRYAFGVVLTHTDGNGITFNGTEGKIQVNRGKFELWLGGEQKAAATRQLREVADAYLADAPIRLYESRDHRGDWLSCIRTRKKPICDVAIGASTVTVCHLVNLAYFHHEKMKWNPKGWRFSHGTGDKKWLDVPHRDPWTLRG